VLLYHKARARGGIGEGVRGGWDKAWRLLTPGEGPGHTGRGEVGGLEQGQGPKG
jgi:hypothetical protein